MSIVFQVDLGLFILNMNSTTYALQVNSRKRLVYVYWGSRLPRAEDLPLGEQLQFYPFEEEEKKFRVNEEYVGWGGYFFDEPCLEAKFADGVRDLSLLYHSHEITEDHSSQTLRILQRDEIYPLQVTLVYQLYPDSDIVDRCCVLENLGVDPIYLENVQSGVCRTGHTK